MKSDDVIVKNSSIDGKGVFAARDFQEGEVILHWDISHTLEKEAVDKISDEEKKYIAFLDGKYVIMQKPAKYVNYSHEANTTAKNFCDIAIRDIKKGEEITGDYAEELPTGANMECSCGSKRCNR